MGNVERVMERVHRLLAIANDPAASDNEQHIALEQAQRLMNKHGYDSGLTRARRAVTRRISLMESPLTDEELLLLDGWSPTPTALWRLKARGSID